MVRLSFTMYYIDTIVLTERNFGIGLNAGSGCERSDLFSLFTYMDVNGSPARCEPLAVSIEREKTVLFEQLVRDQLIYLYEREKMYGN
jgi:hypothetical protein